MPYTLYSYNVTPLYGDKEGLFRSSVVKYKDDKPIGLPENLGEFSTRSQALNRNAEHYAKACEFARSLKRDEPSVECDEKGYENFG